MVTRKRKLRTRGSLSEHLRAPRVPHAAQALVQYEIDTPLLELARKIGEDNAVLAWRRAPRRDIAACLLSQPRSCARRSPANAIPMRISTAFG